MSITSDYLFASATWTREECEKEVGEPGTFFQSQYGEWKEYTCLDLGYSVDYHKPEPVVERLIQARRAVAHSRFEKLLDKLGW